MEGAFGRLKMAVKAKPQHQANLGAMASIAALEQKLAAANRTYECLQKEYQDSLQCLARHIGSAAGVRQLAADLEAAHARVHDYRGLLAAAHKTLDRLSPRL
jgi:outer membrane protein TolC